jgi:thiamine biosynthesis protein ThiS
VTPVVSLRINGEERAFYREPTVQEVLEALQVPSSAVAVEVNRTVVPRKQHASCRLRDGDEVEVVTFVGGG